MTDHATLSGLRLADSALPVGKDSVSHGLEQFVETSRVSDTDDLQALLETHLRSRLGRGDLVALRAAHAAAVEGDTDGLRTADNQLEAVMLTAEQRESSTRTGRRLLTLQCSLRDIELLEEYVGSVTKDEVPGHYVVVFGAIAGLEEIPVREACLIACHDFTMDMLRAAQRLIQIGHTDIQRLLDELHPVIVTAVNDSTDRSLDEMAPFTPLGDVLSAAHERADRRLFIS